MLTNARQWGPGALKSSQLLLLLLLLLGGQVLCGDGASVTWGHVNKYASLLYTEDVYLTPERPAKDVLYGSQNNSDSYRITAVHVEDLSSSPAADDDATGNAEEVEALLTKGGIGKHFVVVHCQGRGRQQVLESVQSEHLQVSIYGLEL